MLEETLQNNISWHINFLIVLSRTVSKERALMIVMIKYLTVLQGVMSKTIEIWSVTCQMGSNLRQKK